MKVYILGPEDGHDQDYGDAAMKMRAAGHQVSCLPPVVRLRDELAEMLKCDAICLLDVWWTSVVATQMQQVAGWLRMKHFDQRGKVMPTSSLRGQG